MAAGVKGEVCGDSLTRHYRLSCELLNTYPLPCFTRQLSRASLDLHLDAVDLDHLEALCHTLKNKASPSSIRVTVPTHKQVLVHVVERAVEGVAVCVVSSVTLTSLTLDGVRLRGRSLKVLCEGLRKARSLKTLHVRNCALGDSGTESVCQAVKNVPSVTHLLLVNCGVTEKGGTSVACLIKHQRLNRDSAMWQDTLRQRQPHLDAMRGLRRLTLNGNPALGDQGAAAIAEALTEDLWIKAVDVQHCGVGPGGGAAFCSLLHTNQTVEVVDLHNNPFLPNHTLQEVMSLLKGRCSDPDSQYSWFNPSEVEDEALAVQKEGTAGYRASGRVVKARKGRPLSHTTSRRPKLPSQLGVPWRVEHRLYERREGLLPGTMVKECVRECQSAGNNTQPTKEAVQEGDVELRKIKKKLQHYKRKYRREREHRRRLERKLSRIHTQLRGLHTIDEATVVHIEECFLKFHVFLSMMQSSGEQAQPSSSATVGPSCHPYSEQDTSQAHPQSNNNSNNLHPQTPASLPPSTTPIPSFIQEPVRASTPRTHVIHPHDNKDRGNLVTDKGPDKLEQPLANKDDITNQRIVSPERSVAPSNQSSQSSLSLGSESEMRENGDSVNSSDTMRSNSDENFLPGSAQSRTVSESNGDERMKGERETSNGEYREWIDTGMTDKENDSDERMKGEGELRNRDYGKRTYLRVRDRKNTGNEEVKGEELSNGQPGKATDMRMDTKMKRNILRKEENVSNNRNAPVSSLSSQLSSSSLAKEKKKQSMIMEVDNYFAELSLGEVEKMAIKHKPITVSDADSFAMKMEFCDKSGIVEWKDRNAVYSSDLKREESQPSVWKDEDASEMKTKESHRNKWNDRNVSRLSEMKRKESQPMGDSQPEKDMLTKEFSPKASVTKETDVAWKKQQFIEGDLHDKLIVKTSHSEIRSQQGTSQSSVASHSPIASQSIHSPQSPSRQLIRDSQAVPQLSPTSYVPQAYHSPSHQSPNQSLYRQFPEDSHSPDRIQSLHSPTKVRSPLNLSPKRTRLKQDSQLAQRSKSHQKQSPQSPRKGRSPRTEPPRVQVSEVSETDDEKIRNLKDWLQGRGRRRRTSTPSSSSSVSISEHLQHSHSSWTKSSQGRRRRKHREEVKEEVVEEEELLEGSDIDLSDVEDLSLSGMTLSNTSAPEDSHTPKEEDF